MKKISIISLVTLSILVSAFALPAQGQLTASQDCTLVANIGIDIDVFDTAPPPAAPTGALVTADHIVEIQEGSGIASTAAAMNAPNTPPNVRVTGGAAFVAANTDQTDAIAKEWGSICLVNTINNIVNWLFFIMLTVAFFLIVVAAFIWTTSAGDATKQQTARNMIIAAMVGIVIAVLARLIPAVVLGIVT